MACPKPTIANPVFEVSSLLGQGLSQSDGTTVVTWPDQSGEGNDVTLGAGTPSYETTGWAAGIPAVRCLDGEYFDYAGGPDLNNTELTLFFVIEATDITANLAIIGSASSSSFPRRVTLVVKADGTIIFNFSAAAPGNCASAPGVIVGGERYVIAARFSTTTGMLIRVARAEVATTPSQLTAQVDIGSPVLGRSKDDNLGLGNLTGVDKLFGWASAYHSAASDAEILEMECYLAEQFALPGLGTDWIPRGTQVPLATTWLPPTGVPALEKPVIAGIQMEYDARQIVGIVDLDPVATWPDSSGQANDASGVNGPTYEETAWDPTSGPDVRCTKVSGNDHFTWDGSGFIASDFALFFVLQAVDMTSGSAVLMGGSSFSDRQIIEIYIATNGSIFFGFFTNETGDSFVRSATGLVVEGDEIILSFRHSSVTGKTIRLAGVEVANAPASTDQLNAYPNPFISNIGNVAWSPDTRFAWVSGYNTDVTDGDMALMEAYLTEQLLGAAPPGPPSPTDWSPA